jgi:predicted ribosomally synthesized peptide with SipW-like signal peptide
MSKKRIKQYLMLLTVIGLVSIASGSGTFASFTAETTNAGNTFATGTIVLSNAVQSGTTCLSTNGGSTDVNQNSTGCNTLFDATVQKPGDSWTTDNLTLWNKGSLDAASLTLTATSCGTADAGGETFHGTGDLCPVLDVYVQEWTDNTFTTPLACWYGGAVVLNTCDFTNSADTLAAISAGPIDLSGTPPALPANGKRYFTVGVELDPTADNTVQGRAATADLTWDIAQ